MNIAVELYIRQLNKCTIKPVNSHVEVFDILNKFLFSADTEQEAEHEIQQMILN